MSVTALSKEADTTSDLKRKLDINLNLQEAEVLNKSVDDDDVMEQVLHHLGGMGTYQRILFVMMMLVGILFSFLYCVQMFIAATPQQHWCRVPELMHLDVDLRRNLSIPGASSGLDWDRCAMFDANWTEVLASLATPAPGTPTVPCRHGWEFLYDDIPYPTVVSEREWVCEKSSYAPTAQALFFLGSLFGGSLFGWMGDKFGRVPSLIGANLVGSLGGIATVFTSSFWDFATCRFIVGMANDSGFMMMYILVLEYVGPQHRSWVGNISLAIFSGLGGVILAGLAYWLKNWRLLLLVTTTPMLLVITMPWIMPESARCLLIASSRIIGIFILLQAAALKRIATTGKLKRALKVLKKFERINKTEIPEDVLQKFIKSSNKTVETDESMTALIRSAPIRNSFICLIIVTIVGSIVIDAIIRMSESIGSSFFVTFALSSLVELPSLTLVAFILDRLGRRFLTFLTLFMAGVFLLVCAFVPQGMPQLVLALMVRFSVNMSLGILLQLGTELLPTGLRALGTSIIHITVFVATMFSPYIVYSGTLWRSLPLVILGAMSLLGGGTALLLPETKGKPLPQTIADGERLVREGRLCGKPEKEDPGNKI